MLIFYSEFIISASKIDYQIKTRVRQSALEFACARASAVLLIRKREKWPLVASNDFRGKNEYAYSLNVVILDGVFEIKFLAKISHFHVKRVQTGDRHRFYIYRLKSRNAKI